MNMRLLLIETIILFILTFIYCSLKISSIYSKEEYEKNI